MRNSYFHVATLFLVLLGCAHEETRVDSDFTLAVSSESVSKVRFQPTVASFGTISFTSKVDLTSSVEGRVIELHVDEGSRVTRNQLLARLENVQLEIQKQKVQSEIDQASAGLALADARMVEGRRQVLARLTSLERLQLSIRQSQLELADLGKQLGNKQALLAIDGATQEEISQLELKLAAGNTQLQSMNLELEVQSLGLRDQDIRDSGLQVPTDPERRLRVLQDINTLTLKAERDVALARQRSAYSERETLNLLLRELEIRAFSGGIIGARYIELGERIKPETKLFTTFDNREVFAVFPVPESLVGILQQGQRVSVFVPALDSREYNGILDLVSPLVDAQSGNLNIKARLTNYGQELKPGMFVRATVYTGVETQGLAISPRALLEKQGMNAKVFQILNGRAVLRDVVLHIMEETRALVQSGLSEGDVVVVSPPPILREGMSVQVQE